MGGVSLFSDMWEQIVHFQLIWAVDIANHRFYSSLWFNWKLSACTLEVWEKDLFFRVLPLLVMEVFTPLHTASLLRLLPTSGQLADKGGLSKTDCLAQLCSGWSAEVTHATLATVGRRGRTVQFCPHLLISIFFFHILDCCWSLKANLRLRNKKTPHNSMGACCIPHTQSSTLVSSLPC